MLIGLPYWRLWRDVGSRGNQAMRNAMIELQIALLGL